MEQEEVIEKIIKKQNKNLTSSQKIAFDGDSLILSLNNKKNKVMLAIACLFIASGAYLIYSRYTATGQISQELWHWGLPVLGLLAIFNRKKLATQRTVVDTRDRIIKRFVKGNLKNSIPFSEATDFLIESIKMRGGGFGIQSAVYVRNNKGKILLGILTEESESEEYVELLKTFLTFYPDQG